MPVAAQVSLLYTASFDIGAQPVQLLGVITAGQDGFDFDLGSSIPAGALLGPGVVPTQRIEAPLGLTGVALDLPVLAGTIRRAPDGSARIDFSIGATATFPSLPGFSLTGAIELENNQAILALAVLQASPPLTLTGFLRSVFGGTLSWADVVTDQFAFGFGLLYRLSPPAGSPADYTRPFTLPGGKVIQCRPGYRVEGAFRVFGEFDFAIALETAGKTFTLVTTIASQINVFDFIVLTGTMLEIANAASGTHLRLKTGIAVLSTPLSAIVTADYNTESGEFRGSVQADLGNIAGAHVQLGIDFAWSRKSGASGGLRIIQFSGLPLATLDMAREFLGKLNAGGNCNKLVGDWLNNFASSKFAPSLNGSPTRRSDGRMSVPLKLSYTLSVVGGEAFSGQVTASAIITVPGRLSDFPEALLVSIGESAAQIAADVLSNPNAYRIVALEAARVGGSAALARFICRALEQGLENLAKSLADAAASVVADSIAAAAELAGQLISVALLGVNAVVSFLKGILDEIKKLFGGGSSEKDEAEAKIRAERAKAEASVKAVDDRIAAMKQHIAIRTLVTSLDDQGRVVADVTWAAGTPTGLDAGTNLACTLDLLAGGTVVLHKTSAWFPDVTPLAALPAGTDYRMNARAQSVLTGVTLLDSRTRSSMDDAINQLNSIDNGVAQDFARYLAGKRDEYLGYSRSGIASDWVYATTDVPPFMTIGRSRIGFNTRIAA